MLRAIIKDLETQSVLAKRWCPTHTSATRWYKDYETSHLTILSIVPEAVCTEEELNDL